MDGEHNEHTEERLFNWFDDDTMHLAQTNDEIIGARATIVNLLAEIEDILFRQNPRIEVEWQLVIGAWENKLLEAQIAMRRARRKCTLMQASVNKREPIDIQHIESLLDDELAQWEQQLEDATQRFESAKTSQLNAVEISSADNQEQKKLFRTLAKRLHPDLHPDLDESQRALFALAELAYRQGDTKMLKSLEASTRNLATGANLPTDLEQAQEELALLQKQTSEIEERMEHIKAERPYCLKALLNDSSWVDDRVEHLKEEIETCKATMRDYSLRCNELAGAHG